MKCFFLLAFVFFSIGITNGQTGLVLPHDGFITNDKTIIFSWDPIQEADYYSLEIDINSTFSSPVIYSIHANDTVFSLNFGQYYWRVQSYNNGVPNNYSNTRSFKVIDINNYALKAWYSADSNITYDGSNLVSSWDDISGQNNHAIQTNSSNKPKYISTVEKLNNNATLRFDGSSILNTPNLNTNTMEVLMIGKGNNQQNNFLGIGLGYR